MSFLFLFGLIICITTPHSCFGLLVNENAKLVASDPQKNDYFGESVSIWGNNIAFVGANADDDRGSSSGSVYIFERLDNDSSIWNQTSKLVASDGTSSDYFGESISIASNVAIVGAYGAYKAYIFERNDSSSEWNEVVILQASDGGGVNYYGVSVAISNNDVAVIGARLDDNDNGNDAGAAYIVQRDSAGWTETQKLVASDGAEQDWYGTSVAISKNGNYIIVGAYRVDKAYIYERNDTTGDYYETAVLTGPFDSNFAFGIAIIDEGIALVGAYGDAPFGVDSAGSAYIYKRDSTTGVWEQDAKIWASDVLTDSYFFGEAVSLTSEYAVIGARGNDKAYIFRPSDDINECNSTWCEVATFDASDTMDNDRFGVSVSISDNIVVVGARLNDPNGIENAGAAYIFSGFEPTLAPISRPTMVPSSVPTAVPSKIPSMMPSGVPSSVPSGIPSTVPSMVPTSMPNNISLASTGMPSSIPSEIPTSMPNDVMMPGTSTSSTDMQTVMTTVMDDMVDGNFSFGSNETEGMVSTTANSDGDDAVVVGVSAGVWSGLLVLQAAFYLFEYI